VLYDRTLAVNIPGEGVAMFPWILFPQIVRISRGGPSKEHRYYEHQYGSHR
jgi:hypothetical protein